MNETGPDTIFYTLKLKRTRTPAELFEKMVKSIKKKDVTKNWTYTIDTEKQILFVDFGDEMSETFSISFDEEKICNDFCKVYFPINGELFDDEKRSEFKALLNMIWSARTMFSKMDVSDDYGLATDFLESKKYKLSLRELTEAENSLGRELYESGLTKYPDFIIGIILRGLDIPVNDKWYNHVNMDLPFVRENMKDEITCMWPFFETYVYEAAEYKNVRVKYHRDFNSDFTGLWFSVGAFKMMIDELYHFRDYFNHNSNNSFGVKHAQLRRVYKDKVYPLLDSMPDCFEQCCIAYRFFLSAFDFCGFKYVGIEK